MYDWLSDALQDSSQVVTANRRLARVLSEEFGKQQFAMGRSVWRSPAVRSWQDWLLELLASAELSQPLPTRINGHQSRVLWERCLRREITDPLLNIGMLVRQARESWTRLHDFRVPLEECRSAAEGKDQKIFASAAKSYQSILDREEWIDDAGISGVLTTFVINGQVSLPQELTFAGFDRFAPDAMLLLDSVREAGTHVTVAPQSQFERETEIHAYENSDAEFRAAGAWARQQLQDAPQQSVGVIATHLEQDANRSARMIREGLTPAWQTSGPQFKAAVNVSYGRKLSTYPVIAVALLALRWLRSDISSRDVSMLLRTPTIGRREIAGRSRLELILRRVPDRNWSPSMILGELDNRDKTDDARDWFTRVSILDNFRSDLPHRNSPSRWAVLIDEVLTKINWPGDGSLDSIEFQVLNRWKELLNDLARLQLVTPTMTLSEVLGRLLTMAGEIVFQPESTGSILQVLGPLEAAGMRFDKLWITGVSAANWPPQGRPSALLSRKIQRKYGMPDATPENTLEYASRVLQRLLTSAEQSICSFPLSDGDAEQSESGLLADIVAETTDAPGDPGWYARHLSSHSKTTVVLSDPVSPVTSSETISGGAATIQRQFEEPFSAFAYGRLGVRSIPPIYNGLAASLRGNLIHDALHGFYAELPSKADIDSWHGPDIEKRIARALARAFWRRERHADSVLKQLYGLEQQRVARLLRAVIKLDQGRDNFAVAETEGELDTLISGVRLALRVDRIDRLENGAIFILDYKTGMPKQFLGGNGEPKDMQLLVYACAVQASVAGLGLFNVDSRSVGIEGAGLMFTHDLNWDETLANWKSKVEYAAADLQRGDVRIDRLQNDKRARALALLSRIRELRRDA